MNWLYSDCMINQSMIKLDAAGGKEHCAEGVKHCECRDWTRTIFLRGPDEDYTMSTKGRMLERLHVILAGRAAEEVLLCKLDCFAHGNSCGDTLGWGCRLRTGIHLAILCITDSRPSAAQLACWEL